MATYSNIGIKLITTGDESGTWGTSTNTNFSDVLDEAIAGAVTYNISSDADFTLTVSDGTSSDARHAVIKFTSTTLTATRVCTFAPNTLQKTWVVINATTGGQSLTFKQGSAGGTVTVPNGESAIIYSDGAGGTNGAVVRVLDSFTNTKITTGTLNATTLDLTNLEVTNIKAKDGTAALTIADSTGKVTVSTELAVDNINVSGNAITSTDTNGNIDLTPNGTGEVNITKVDIDSGAIDGTTIGGSTAAAGSFTTLTSSSTVTVNGGTANQVQYLNASKQQVGSANLTFDGTTLATTTVDATNVEVTNIKAKDGTAAASIADSTGVISVTANPILSGGTANGVLYLNGSKVATSGSAITYNGTTFGVDSAAVFNDSGADVDFRIEGDTDANLFFADASTDRIGIGTNSPLSKLQVAGQTRISGGSAGTAALVIPAGDILADVSTGQFEIRNDGNASSEMRVSSRGFATIYTGGSGLNTGTERLRVTSAGDVGIGTSSPISAVGGSVTAAGVFAASGYLSAHQTSKGILEWNANITRIRSYGATASTGVIAFNVGGGGGSADSEAMRLDASGNLGLGVTPSASSVRTFEVGAVGNTLTGIGGGDVALMSNAYYNAGFKYAGSNLASSYRQQDGVHKWNIAASGTAGNAITFTQAMTLDAGGRLLIGRITSDANNYRLQISQGSATYGSGIQLVYEGAGAAAIWENSSGALVFGNDGADGDTERARITSGGAFLVGTATGTYTGAGCINSTVSTTDDFCFSGVNSNSTNPRGVYIRLTNTTAGDYAYYLEASGAAKFYVNGNGVIYSTNTSVQSVSDARHKENVRDLDKGLAEVLALKPRRFDWKEGKGTGAKDVAGFIAQEVETVLPELVGEWKETVDAEETFKSIGMANVIPMLVKAIQELKAELDAAKVKIAALEAK